MTEEEILIRAQEACISAYSFEVVADEIRAEPITSDRYGLPAVVRALRDLSKSLSEIQPVDPDLLEARQIAARRIEARGGHRFWSYHAGDADTCARRMREGRDDDEELIQGLLAAIKRGRELERNQ